MNIKQGKSKIFVPETTEPAFKEESGFVRSKADRRIIYDRDRRSDTGLTDVFFIRI